MKRVLFIATNDFNTFGGGPQAVRAFLDSTLDIFGADNVDVMVGSEYIILDEYRDCCFIKVNRRTRIKGIWEFIFKGYVERWTGAILSHIKQHKDKYELIIINSSRSGIILPEISKYGIQVVTIHHNDEVEYCMDNKTIYTFHGVVPYFVNRNQQLAYEYSNINIFLTSSDCDSFANRYGCNEKLNKVVGIYDYKSSTIITPCEKTPEYDIGISGSLQDYQTIHGILDVNENYYKIMNDIIPNCKLLITGRNPSHKLVNFINNNWGNVTIVPSPKDIFEVLQSCAIYLCPTDIGGGIKLRVMDGLKLGKPILVHKVSARGYNMFYDKPYFRVYHDKDTFVQSLKELIQYKNSSDGNISKLINRDYYAYFGYQEGTLRFSNAIKNY